MAEARVLILGGTREARELAAVLCERRIALPVTSLAGATRNPPKVAGEVRTGAIGGIVGLTKQLREHRYAAVVDATHPFAAQISGNAAIACDAACIDRLVLIRAPWEPRSGDCWIDADSEDHAIATIQEMALPPGATIFLALGAKRISPFSALRDKRVVLRTVDPIEPSFPGCTVLTGRGPFSQEAEIALFKAHAVDLLVCRNSGGSGHSKLDAAGVLGIPVVVIHRPPAIRGKIVTEVEQAVRWIVETIAKAT